jgi:Lipase (class 3)
MILRRIVFGEALPGMQRFADILKGLDESIAYCNRSGPLEHDRVTDFPFAVPLVGLGFIHPTSQLFVRGDPPADDPLGLFRWHHSYLYRDGARSAGLDPVHVEAARLCDAIYAKPGTPSELWTFRAATNGVEWGIKLEGRRAYVVFRGSDDLLDWLRDITGFDISLMLTRLIMHDRLGRMWEGFVIGTPEAWAAIKAALASLDLDEIIFTGHSLGADHADVAAAYAVLERSPS